MPPFHFACLGGACTGSRMAGALLQTPNHRASSRRGPPNAQRPPAEGPEPPHSRQTPNSCASTMDSAATAEAIAVTPPWPLSVRRRSCAPHACSRRRRQQRRRPWRRRQAGRAPQTRTRSRPPPSRPRRRCCCRPVARPRHSRIRPHRLPPPQAPARWRRAAAGRPVPQWGRSCHKRPHRQRPACFVWQRRPRMPWPPWQPQAAQRCRRRPP